MVLISMKKCEKIPSIFTLKLVETQFCSFSFSRGKMAIRVLELIWRIDGFFFEIRIILVLIEKFTLLVGQPGWATSSSPNFSIVSLQSWCLFSSFYGVQLRASLARDSKLNWSYNWRAKIYLKWGPWLKS